MGQGTFLLGGNYGKPVPPVLLPTPINQTIKAYAKRNVFTVIESCRLTEHIPLPRDHYVAAVFMRDDYAVVEVFQPEVLLERAYSGRTSTGDRFDIALKYHRCNLVELVQMIEQHSLFHNL